MKLWFNLGMAVLMLPFLFVGFVWEYVRGAFMAGVQLADKVKLGNKERTIK